MTPASSQEDGRFREAADLLDEGVREEAYAAAVLLVGRGRRGPLRAVRRLRTIGVAVRHRLPYEADHGRSFLRFVAGGTPFPRRHRRGGPPVHVARPEGPGDPVRSSSLPYVRTTRLARSVPGIGGCGNGGRKADVRRGGRARSNTRRRPLPPSVARPRGRLGIQRSRVHAARPRDRGRRLPLPRPAAHGEGHRPPRDAGDPVPASCRGSASARRGG